MSSSKKSTKPVDAFWVRAGLLFMVIATAAAAYRQGQILSYDVAALGVFDRFIRFLNISSPAVLLQNFESIFFAMPGFQQLGLAAVFFGLNGWITSLLIPWTAYTTYNFFEHNYRPDLARWSYGLMLLSALAFFLFRSEYFVTLTLENGIRLVVVAAACTIFVITTLLLVTGRFLFFTSEGWPGAKEEGALLNVPALPVAIAIFLLLSHKFYTFHPFVYLIGYATVAALFVLWKSYGRYFVSRRELRSDLTTATPDDAQPNFLRKLSKLIFPVAGRSVAIANLPAISRPAEGILLKFRRDQRTTIFGKLRFTLDARLAVSNEDAALIQKFKLQPLVVYDSANREKYAQQAKEFIESPDRPKLFAPPEKGFLWELLKGLYRLLRIILSLGFMTLSLRITIAKLLSGIHIESYDLNELINAENAIYDAARNVRGYLDNAAKYNGSEVLIEL